MSEGGEVVVKFVSLRMLVREGETMGTWRQWDVYPDMLDEDFPHYVSNVTSLSLHLDIKHTTYIRNTRLTSQLRGSYLYVIMVNKRR